MWKGHSVTSCMAESLFFLFSLFIDCAPSSQQVLAALPSPLTPLGLFQQPLEHGYSTPPTVTIGSPEIQITKISSCINSKLIDRWTQEPNKQRLKYCV